MRKENNERLTENFHKMNRAHNEMCRPVVKNNEENQSNQLFFLFTVIEVYEVRIR